MSRIQRALASAALVLGLGCAALVDPWERRGVDPADRAHFVEPWRGYPERLGASERDELGAAYERLQASADLAEARAWAVRRLERRPGWAPVEVFLAGVELLERDARGARDRLAPVVERHPEYVAARLLAGRAAERLGDVPGAYEELAAVAALDDRAASRAEELLPRATEILSRRIEAAVGRGHVDAASESLERLTAWAPEATPTLEARALVARHADEPEEELRAVRALCERFPDSLAWWTRRAELEVLAGDPGTGVQLLQDLVRQQPGDRELERKYAWAVFEWRLAVLPEDVRRLAGRPALTRGDLASLVFWLVPGVRAARGAEGRIAADILDHPRREELARVVNLGLMDLDPAVHRFEPQREVERGEVLETLLRFLASGPTPHPCLERQTAPGRRAEGPLCRAAARCRLIAEEADCLPEIVATGRDAVTLIRRALVLQPAR